MPPSIETAAPIHELRIADQPLRPTDHARDAEPWAFPAARFLLVAALLGAPLAFGGMITWACVALGLVASLALFLWAMGAVRQGPLEFIWSPLYIPPAPFFLFGLVQYWARLTLDR